jgi:hypothetical protein
MAMVVVIDEGLTNDGGQANDCGVKWIRSRLERVEERTYE